jgi:hypothetical protein
LNAAGGRFFELAFVDLDVRRQGREACVVLKDFAIPSEDLIPLKVRESIATWSDLIDYWSVDFDFSRATPRAHPHRHRPRAGWQHGLWPGLRRPAPV